MLCLSPSATVKLIQDLSIDHDEKVCEWRDSLLPPVPTEVFRGFHLIKMNH